MITAQEILAPIPDFQSIPFPAPVWLLKVLLVIGFYLHAIPMNVALMGGITAAIFTLVGNTQNHAFAKRIGASLAFSLPFFVSVAITQGIVPLLFLQLVYGPLFYTSSIIIGLPWLLLLGILLTAYYTYYLHTYRREKLGPLGPWVLLGAGLLFMMVAFLFTNNTTLMLTPDRWVPLYQNNASGANLNLGEPQLIPRYLHFILAATAVTGLTIGSFGLYWHPRERAYGEWLIRTGSAIYLLVTLVQIPVGIWFLLMLRDSAMANLLGGDTGGTAVFFSSMVMDVLSLAALAMAWQSGRPRPFQVGLAAALIVVFLMVVIRHLVRVYYIQEFFQPELFPVNTQWILLTIFLVSVVVGIGYIVWLLKITWDAFHPAPGTSRPADTA